MRKITAEMADCLRYRFTRTKGNTSVFRDAASDEYVMTLHGNEIARLDRTNKLRVTLAGWNTPTTRERVNGVLETCGIGQRFCQRDWEACLLSPHGEAIVIDDEQWFSFTVD